MYPFCTCLSVFQERALVVIISPVISLVSLAPPTSDVLSPAVVSVSELGPHQIQVSWGPLQPTQVQKYTVEYGAIPSGRVHTVTLRSQLNSTILTGLAAGTQYLVTVSALHVNGKERAMSVRACTKEGMFSILGFYFCVHKCVVWSFTSLFLMSEGLVFVG